MTVRRLLFVAASLALASCATAPPEFDRLADASGRVVFLLEHGIQVKGGDDPIYLASGPYRIVKSGAAGSMFVAADYGVIRRTARGYLGYSGGVWIPRDVNSTAKVFVFVGMRERLYADLTSALTLPAQTALKMAEEAASEGIDYDKIERQRCEEQPLSDRGWATVLLLCAIVEAQRGKPDVIAELPRPEFEALIGPSVPARERR